MIGQLRYALVASLLEGFLIGQLNYVAQQLNYVLPPSQTQISTSASLESSASWSPKLFSHDSKGVIINSCIYVIMDNNGKTSAKKRRLRLAGK